MKKLFFIFFVYSTLYGFGQSSISGKTDIPSGSIVKLIEYNDFITYKTIEVSRDTIDSLGQFEFNIELEKTKFFILESVVQTAVYVEPNNKYQITIKMPDEQLNYNEEPVYVVPVFENKELSNINNLLTSFNIDYDDFVASNLNLFIQKGAKQKVDTFYFQSLKKYSNFIGDSTDKNNYFRDYINYSLAGLRSASAYTQKKKLYKQYLESKPILYNNDSYMDFFNQFYKGHLQTLPVLYQDEIIEAITVKMSLESLNEILKRDDYLNNDSIKELVLLKVLKENYRNPAYSRKGILMILKQVIEQTNNEEHLKIALNIYQKLSSVDKGSFAPEFELPDLEGNLVSLSELSKYKFVYLDFWATWCAPCVKEMKLMPELYKEFGDDIAFVSISIDKKVKTVQKFAEKNNYNWTILHYDGQEELLDLYKTKVIPTYYLIAPGGKVLESPANRPSSIKPEFLEIKRTLEQRR